MLRRGDLPYSVHANNIGLQCLVQLPVYTGFTTYVMQSFDLARFCEIVQKYQITYTYVAPPVVVHLAKNPIVDNYDLASLKSITSGAAPLTKDLIEAVHKRLNVCTKQAYGLSETSPVVFIQVSAERAKPFIYTSKNGQ